MKKALTLLLMVLVIGMPLSLAEEEATTTETSDTTTEDVVDETTAEEIKVMSNGIGAEIRLLQLEKRITRNILVGNEVIAAVEEAGEETSELEAIISEMELLKKEVQEADPTAEDAAKIYVDLKSDAIDLSQQFREKANDLLGEQERVQIRERVREMSNDEITGLQEKIQNRIRTYNTEQVKSMFEIAGITDEALLAKVENGEATKAEIKEALRTALQGMDKDEKKAAMIEMKEQGIKRNVFQMNAVEQARLNNAVRKEERLTNRLNKLGNAEDKVQERLQERIQERIDGLGGMGGNGGGNMGNGMQNGGGGKR